MVDVTGTFGPTEAKDTAAFSGSVIPAITGTLGATEAHDTAAFRAVQECASCLYFRNNQCRYYEPQLIVGQQTQWPEVEPTDWCAAYTAGISPAAQNCGTCFSFRNNRCQYNAPVRISPLETTWPLVANTDWCGQWSTDPPPHEVSVSSLNQPWVPYTPTVAPTIGALGTTSSSGAYKKIGSLVVFRIWIWVQLNGTGAGSLLVSAPFATVAAPAPAVATVPFVAAVLTAGRAPLMALLSDNTSQIEVTDTAGAYPVADNNIVLISGSYESAP